MSEPEWQDLQRSGIFEYVSPTWFDENNITICMWASISEVKSSSLRLRPNMASAFRPLRSQNPRDGPRQPLPFVGLFD